MKILKNVTNLVELAWKLKKATTGGYTVEVNR